MLQFCVDTFQNTCRYDMSLQHILGYVYSDFFPVTTTFPFVYQDLFSSVSILCNTGRYIQRSTKVMLQGHAEATCSDKIIFKGVQRRGHVVGTKFHRYAMFPRVNSTGFCRGYMIVCVY